MVALFACSAPPNDPNANNQCLAMGTCSPPGTDAATVSTPDLAGSPAPPDMVMSSPPDLAPMVDPCKDYYGFPVNPKDPMSGDKMKWACNAPNAPLFECTFTVWPKDAMCVLQCVGKFSCQMSPQMMGVNHFSCIPFSDTEEVSCKTIPTS
ncbi:MAG: hypothetical protein EXS55_02820 [Candidatus Magasanikbacteria bacterium]|nr:hypothetical protein [Candidatus Magasanikbacteria bacterium]